MEHAELTSDFLLGLTHTATADLFPLYLREFLSQHLYPWQALGEPLLVFLKGLILSVPVAARREGTIHDGAYLQGEDIVIEDGATVEPGAFISGPCYVAQGAVVRHGAYLRDGMYVGPGAMVGHATECKGSLLCPKAHAPHFNYVGDSILGPHVNLGAGTILSNLRLDRNNISVRSKEKIKIPTGLRKFGAILGHRSQTACNVVLNPGTVLAPNEFVLQGNFKRVSS